MFPLEYVVGGVISVSGGVGRQSGVQGQGAIINLSNWHLTLVFRRYSSGTYEIIEVLYSYFYICIYIGCTCLFGNTVSVALFYFSVCKGVFM